MISRARVVNVEIAIPARWRIVMNVPEDVTEQEIRALIATQGEGVGLHWAGTDGSVSEAIVERVLFDGIPDECADTVVRTNGRLVLVPYRHDGEVDGESAGNASR